MKRLFPYIITPLLLFCTIMLFTETFDLLSAASDLKVLLGVCLAIGIFAIVYYYFTSIFKNSN